MTANAIAADTTRCLFCDRGSHAALALAAAGQRRGKKCERIAGAAADEPARSVEASALPPSGGFGSAAHRRARAALQDRRGPVATGARLGFALRTILGREAGCSGGLSGQA